MEIGMVFGSRVVVAVLYRRPSSGAWYRAVQRLEEETRKLELLAGVLA